MATFHGTRKRGEKIEGVIGLKVELVANKGFSERMGGKGRGLAVIDLETGVITSTHVKLAYDHTAFDGFGEHGVLEITLNRSAK
jgi:hypothetical protein